MNALTLAANIVKSVNPNLPKVEKAPKAEKQPKAPKPPKAPKARKPKKEVEEVEVIVTSGEAFCAKSAQEKIRAAFQIKPSPQKMRFPTPYGVIHVSREKEKGAQAVWFATDEVGKTYKGDKRAVRENVGEMIAISHRLSKMGKTLTRPQGISLQ